MGAGTADAELFDAWNRRAKISFAGYDKPETLTNFPALVVLGPHIPGFAYGDFRSGPYDDLRFSDAARTVELAYEVEHWNTNGESFVWVRIPELATTNDFIYAFWEKEGESAPDSGTVWGADYVGVWHMGQTNALDSSTNQFHGTARGAVTLTEAGRINGACDFDADLDYIAVPDSDAFTLTNEFTFSAWVRPDPLSDYSPIMGSYNGAGFIFTIFNDANNTLQFWDGVWRNSGAAVPDNTWSHVAYTRAGTAGQFYVNGIRVATLAGVTGTGNGGELQLGKGGTSWTTQYHDGLLDELRIESASRGSNWVWACAENQTPDSAFITYGNSITQLRPDVDNAAGATNITLDSAWLNGSLNSTGAFATTVFLFWGASDGGTNAAVWLNTNSWAAGVPPEDLTYQATGLSSNTVYFYRHAASNEGGMVWAPSTESFLTGELDIQAMANAYESSLTPGVFEVYRPDPATNMALTVYYTQSGGTAVPGVDFEALSGVVTIPEGESFAQILVVPLKNYAGTSNTTVELTLTDAKAVIGPASNAFLTIVAESYPDWPTNTWIRGGGSLSAGTDAHWSLGHAPTNGEMVLLGPYSLAADMTWDLTNVVVAGWVQESGFTGTVTFTTTYEGYTFPVFQIGGEAEVLGGRWTQVANTGGGLEVNRLAVQVSGDFTLGSNALIDVEQKGYARANGPAAGSTGTSGRGAGHGGHASPGVDWVPPLPTYGSVFTPTNLGSGADFVGGGAVWLVVDGAATVDGAIRANGTGSPTVYRNPGSAGGSIFLKAGDLAGAGSLEASGGMSWGNTGSGGGGRIAVVLTNGIAVPADLVLQAYGAPGTLFPSAAGTVYVQTAGQSEGEGVLIVDNNNLKTRQSLNTWFICTLIPDAGPLNGDHDLSQLAALVVTNGAILGLNTNTVFDFGAVPIHGAGASDISKWRTVDAAPPAAEIAVRGTNFVTFPDPFVISNYTLSLDVPVRFVGNWIVASNGALSHSGNLGPPPGEEEFRLVLELFGNLTVDAGSAIEVNTRGYFNGRGPAPGVYGQGKRGASHGGMGAYGANSLSSPSLPGYGNAILPTTLGSGGNQYTGGSPYRNGGGSVDLTVHGTTTVHGLISARQTLATQYRSAGAAGGSILLRTEHLQGDGVLEAWGDSSESNSGAGGGGRIAVLLMGSESFGAVTMNARGNTGAGNSAGGTVYREMASQSGGRGVVTFDNLVATITNVLTLLPSTGTPEGDDLAKATLQIQGLARVGLTNGNLTAGDLYISTNTQCRLYLKGNTLSLNAQFHEDWGHEDWVVYDGGQILWKTYKGTLIWIR